MNSSWTMFRLFPVVHPLIDLLAADGLEARGIVDGSEAPVDLNVKLSGGRRRGTLCSLFY
jgi:hypothetical protein